MRNCIRCGSEMIENCAVETDDVHKPFTNVFAKIFLYINANSALKKKIGTMAVSICPQCGEVSFYVEDVNKIK